MRVREVPIGDAVLKCATWNPRKEATGHLHYIDLSSVDKDMKAITQTVRVACADAPSRARQIVAAGDVLVATVRPNLNGVAMVEASHDGMTASTGYCVLRPNPSVLDARYLFQWVRTNDFVGRMVAVATGASYPAVSDKKIRASLIPLPPLSDQERIAKILDAADALRAKRRESIALLDELLHSTFLDMFGDPVTNPKGWKRAKLGSLGNVITGSTPSRKRPEYYGDEIEWIKSGNINTPSFVLTEAEEWLSKAGKSVARTCPPGSILVTCIAGSPSVIGNAAIADREVAFNQQINAFVPGPDVSTWFAFSTFLVGKALVQRQSTNSMKGMVSKSAFCDIEIPVPPAAAQSRFAQFAEALVRQKQLSAAHGADLDRLFASLQQRAFRGEL